MQIVCISRGSYDYSKTLAEKLAGKLGCACISREMITDTATDFGIPVGRLEVAVLKNRPITEGMAIEVDLFKAFVTTYLCERALNESLVYHGRTGHLVLPGLSHVLRVRAIAEMDARVKNSAERMNISWEKAKQYNVQVDEDIRRWVRRLYNVDWDDPSLYDMTISASHLSEENAAAILMNMAQMPEFTITPASRQALQDLLLAARCRLAIGMETGTQDLKVSVQARKGEVSVTYPPQEERRAKEIPRILGQVPGMQSLVCTVASSNILYVAETFQAESPEFTHLVEIAEKWNAAVDVVHLSSEAAPEAEPESAAPLLAAKSAGDGGILDDRDAGQAQRIKKEGVPEVMDKLIQAGRAGKLRNIGGGPAGLVTQIPKTESYNLIVVGEVFAEKKLSKQRLKRDFLSLLADKFRVPVLGTEDLKSQYLFGPRQLVSLIGSLALAIVIYALAFTNQEPVMKFMAAGQTHGSFGAKVAATVFVLAFTPIVAFTVGAFYKNLLKLLKIE
ncbi:MAG: cytidylate kinase-like family protein [Thermodesulfobacteriota bacterium]